MVCRTPVATGEFLHAESGFAGCRSYGFQRLFKKVATDLRQQTLRGDIVIFCAFCPLWRAELRRWFAFADNASEIILIQTVAAGDDAEVLPCFAFILSPGLGAIDEIQIKVLVIPSEAARGLLRGRTGFSGDRAFGVIQGGHAGHRFEQIRIEIGFAGLLQEAFLGFARVIPPTQQLARTCEQFPLVAISRAAIG